MTGWSNDFCKGAGYKALLFSSVVYLFPRFFLTSFHKSNVQPESAKLNQHNRQHTHTQSHSRRFRTKNQPTRNKHKPRHHLYLYQPQQHQPPKQWPRAGTPQTIAPSAAGTSPSTHGTTTPTPVIGAPSPEPAPAPELGARTRATVSVSVNTSTKPPSDAPGVEAAIGLLRTITTFRGDIARLPSR